MSQRTSHRSATKGPKAVALPPDLERLRQDIAARHQWAAGADRDARYADRASLDHERAARYRQEAAALSRKLEVQREERLREIKRIQVGRRAVAMSEDAYRACCLRLSQERTNSCGMLTAAERAALLEELKSKGFKPKPKAAPGDGKRRSTPSLADLDRKTLLSKINAQLASQHLPWSYADAILKRQRGHGPRVSARVQQATDEELRGVIAALWRRAKRQAPRTATQEGASA